ncbi:MAG: hypothetical protein HY787_08420 [Deltaproteobacteria bacterium]|nr:hypothetical protein [Deltaproteobacteria bacterium]
MKTHRRITLLFIATLIGTTAVGLMGQVEAQPASTCADSPSGLVSCWSGESTPVDEVGGKVVTLYGNTTYAPGKFGYAFSFDGNKDWVQTPQVINEWPTGTIELWVKFDVVGDRGGHHNQIFASGHSSNNVDSILLWGTGWGLAYPYGFTFNFCVPAIPCGYQSVYSYIKPVAGNWYHVVATWGSEGMKLYVDGALKGTNAYTGAAPSTTYHLIGASFWDQFYTGPWSTDGLIDEVKIYDRALTTDEVRANYCRGIAAIFSDGIFNPENWTSTLITTSGSLTTVQNSTGGNPDKFYQVNHNNFSGTLFAVHYQNTAIYNPAVEGAIDTVDWTLDAKAIINYADIGVAFSVVLQQDGRNYIPNPTIPVGSYYRLNNSYSWSRFGATGMRASDFYDLADFLSSGTLVNHPDFSSSGKPILFGFITANDNSTATASRASGFDNWQTTLNPVTNSAPVAEAGDNQTVDENVSVTLDGSGSLDPDGDSLTYLWEQIAGPEVTLNLSDPIHPSFTAPGVPAGGATLTFQLTVNDGQMTSNPNTVNITIKNINHPPVADAGKDQTVNEGSPVTLNGGNSYDSDGETLIYSWEQISGPSVSLSDPNAVETSFTAPLVGLENANLVFTLTVSDGIDQRTDSVSIFVENVNHPPLADAGEDQTVNEKSLITLNGAGSSDPDGDSLAFLWTQLSGPTAALSDPASPTPSFTTPFVTSGGETFIFRLTVNDGLGGVANDEIIISVLNSNDPPRCDLAQAKPAMIWPPNHKLVPVSIVNLSDPNYEQIVVSILGINQDEPVNGLGDGDTSPDAVINGSKVLLRAERAGNGNGRVYQINFWANDSLGEGCMGTVTICVPHDKKDGACGDDGQNYNSITD